MAWLHSWAGLTLGWLMFAIAATGTASVFKAEIGDWMRPELTARADQVDAVVAATGWLRGAAAGSPTWYLTAPDDRTRATMAGFSAKDAQGKAVYRLVALDPVSGRPDGVRATLGGEFFYRFHFELQLPYPWGRMLASSAAMLLLITLISGVITHRRIFTDLFTLRPGKGKRSWLDAHNALGVLALPFHFMIAFTGILTLISLTLPWGGIAAYGADTARFQAEAAPGHVARDATGRPAPLGDVRAMLVDARARFGGGRIGQVSVDNPGDTAAVLRVTRHDGDQLAYAAASVTYDAVSGRLLSAYREARPAQRSFDVLYGLHMGRFSPAFAHWLYFLCGLALTATIATGMVLWSVSRAGDGFGHGLVGRMTAGITGGLALAMPIFFWANRLLPADMAGRADGEVRSVFIAWGVAILFALLRAPRRGWIEIMALAGAAWLFLPLVSALTTGRALPGSLARGDWLFAGFDLTAIALGAIAIAIAVKTRRHRAPAPRRRQRAAA